MPATLTLATTGQPPQQLTLPTSWADVTLAQYLAAHAPGSPHAPALRLSGLADAVLDSLSTDTAAELAYHMAFATDEAALEALLPTPGLLEIALAAYSLYEHAQGRLATMLDAHPLAFGAYPRALYWTPTGGTTSAEQLAAAHAAVLAQPLPDVYADCQYFLASWARVGQPADYVGATQPGLLRLERPKAPASGLLVKLGQRLRLPGFRRDPLAGLIR